MPEKFRQGAQAKLLARFADRKRYNIVELIYRSKPYEGTAADYEFSRLSMADHWRAGHDDAVRTLQHKEIFELPSNEDGFRTFDFALKQRLASDTKERAVPGLPLAQ